MFLREQRILIKREKLSARIGSQNLYGTFSEGGAILPLSWTANPNPCALTFVFQVKCTIFGLKWVLRIHLDLYASDFPKSMSKYLLFTLPQCNILGCNVFFLLNLSWSIIPVAPPYSAMQCITVQCKSVIFLHLEFKAHLRAEAENFRTIAVRL